MEKNNKPKAAVPIAVFLVNFLKMLMLANATQLGVDFYKLKINFTAVSVVFWISAVGCSALLAVLYATINKKNIRSANLLFALLVLDPTTVLSVRMTSCMLLYIPVYLLLLNALREKPLVNCGLLSVLFSFVCVLAFPHAACSVVPFVVGVYLLSRQNEKITNAKTLITVAAVLAVTVAAVVLNRCLQLTDITMYLNTLSVSQYNARLLLQMAAAHGVFTLCFCYISLHVRESKKDKKGKKKINASKTPAFVSVIPVVVLVISLLCGFKGKTEELFMVNAATPLLLLLSLCKEDERAVRSMQKIDDFVKAHFFVFAVAAVCICYIFFRMTFHHIILDKTIAYLITEN